MEREFSGAAPSEVPASPKRPSSLVAIAVSEPGTSCHHSKNSLVR